MVSAPRSATHAESLGRRSSAASPRWTVVARLGALFWALGLALLFVYLLFYLGRVADLVGYPYDVDQGEGYDVNSAWLLAQGRPIYTDNATYPYYSSNYPPVFSLLLAPIVAQTGPTLGAGRALSAAAALLTAATIALVVRRGAASLPAAATAALFYVGSSYVYHVTPLARVNALAQLFALVGLYCCLRAGRESRVVSHEHVELPTSAARSRGEVYPGWRLRTRESPLARGWLVGAVVAFLLALFTKQTTIDAVAAGLLFLLARDPRAGLVASVAIGMIGLAFLLGLDLAHGGQFWVNVVVGNVNPFIPEQALNYYLNFLGLHAVLVGLGGWHLWRVVRQGAWGPFELYWVLALGLAVSVGKWGAGESYFLAPIIASCVLAGSVLGDAARRTVRRSWGLALLGGLVLLQAVLLAHGPLDDLAPGLRDRGIQAPVLARTRDEADLASAAQLVERLVEVDGPVLAEDPGYNLALGREVVGNATHLRNLHQAGLWRPDRLVADLAERRFSWVVLDAELYPEPVLEAIGRSYYLYDFYDVAGTRQQLFAPGAE